MKKLIALIAFALPLLSVADSPSVHGMLIFGRAHYYVSHLPMYHRPHDYQAVLEVELPPAAQRVFVQDQLTHTSQTVYTLVPESSDLPKKVQELGSFKGTLVRGHFERGGTPILEDIDVKFKKVIRFNKLDAKTPPPAHPQYLVFGEGTEFFAAHLIHGAPDFDEIISVPNTNPKLGILELTDRPADKAIDGNCIPVMGLGRVKTLYLEFGDLKG